MTASEYFDVLGRVDSFKALQTSIDSAQAVVGLVIDRDVAAARPTCCVVV